MLTITTSAGFYLEATSGPGFASDDAAGNRAHGKILFHTLSLVLAIVKRPSPFILSFQAFHRHMVGGLFLTEIMC
jgi:hypothetical protein